jgi:hypothetical protein
VKRSGNCQARIRENNSERLTLDSVELADIPSLLLYPNPTHGQIAISAGNMTQGNTASNGVRKTLSSLGNILNIYNSSGVLIKSLSIKAGSRTVNIDLRGNPAGLYFIETFNGKTKTLHKVVLQD